MSASAKDSPVVQARHLLATVPTRPTDGEDILSVIERLAQVRDLVNEALNEAMAEAALLGASVREVARAAELAPNSVPPRLARSTKLAPYANDGWVSSSSIERARYDSELGRPPEQGKPAPRPPMTFQRRRSSGVKP